MSAQKLGVVGFAVLGVYLVVTWIIQIPALVAFWGNPLFESSASNVGFTLVALFCICAGVFLVATREGMSRWLVGTDEAASDQPRDGLLPMAYAVLGVWLIVAGLSNGSRDIWNLYSTPERGFVPELITSAMTLALGLALFLKSQAVARFWSDSQRKTARDDVPVASAQSTATRWRQAGRPTQRPDEIEKDDAQGRGGNG